MGTAMFYHLTRSSVEATLLSILPRAVAQGWQVMLRGRDRAALERLDEALWLTPPDGFLPHGLEGGPQDMRQPILLGQGPVPPQARGLALVGGAAVTMAEAAALERVWVIFDAADPAELEHARSLWRDITAAGIAAQYWSEDTGRWALKLERQAGPAMA